MMLLCICFLWCSGLMGGFVFSNFYNEVYFFNPSAICELMNS